MHHEFHEMLHLESDNMYLNLHYIFALYFLWCSLVVVLLFLQYSCMRVWMGYNE